MIFFNSFFFCECRDVEGVLYAETGSTYPFNVFDNMNSVKISNFDYDWGDADSVEVDDSFY